VYIVGNIASQERQGGRLRAWTSPIADVSGWWSSPHSRTRVSCRRPSRRLALKEQPDKSVSEIVSRWLASKRVLLVLDNAEHVIEGCVRPLDEMLRRGPDVAILVTSRWE